MEFLGRHKILILGGLILVVIFSLGFLLLKGKEVKKEDVETWKEGTVVTESSKTKALLYLEPADTNIPLNETQAFELKVNFEGGNLAEKLDYFKTEISFPKDYLLVPPEAYPDVSSSPFKKIFRVDGPVTANESGKIIIELGADNPGAGPSTNTDQPATLAKLYFQGKVKTLQTENITIGPTELVNNNAIEIEVVAQDAVFTVGENTGTGGLLTSFQIKFQGKTYIATKGIYTGDDVVSVGSDDSGREIFKRTNQVQDTILVKNPSNQYQIYSLTK